MFQLYMRRSREKFAINDPFRHYCSKAVDTGIRVFKNTGLSIYFFSEETSARYFIVFDNFEAKNIVIHAKKNKIKNRKNNEITNDKICKSPRVIAEVKREVSRSDFFVRMAEL